MSRFFPHTAYAEDQPLSHTILTTHVLTRAVTTGTILGVAAGSLRQLLPSLRRPGPARLMVVSSAATGTVVGLGVTALALVGRMYGREEIEWRDRSWRLMESKGQLETDDWTYVGMGAGAGAAVMSRRVYAVLGWKSLVGGMGLGSVAGVVGYMGWRYGINGGKFAENKKAEVTAL